MISRKRSSILCKAEISLGRCSVDKRFSLQASKTVVERVFHFFSPSLSSIFRRGITEINLFENDVLSEFRFFKLTFKETRPFC